MGDGDYSLDVSEFGAGDYLQIEMPTTTNIQVVFSTTPLNQGGVAVNYGPTVETAGNGIFATRDGVLELGNAGVTGVCAIIVEGKLYARIALKSPSFSVDDCFALTLPLFAYVEGGNIEPVGIDNGNAGWSLFPDLSRVRIAGYNLPTNLTYTDPDASVLDLAADGGAYGIEFTQPSLATFVTVFNAGFWLFFDRRA